MRAKNAIPVLLAAGTLSGCAIEVSGSTNPEVVSSPPTTLELGALSVDSSIAPTNTEAVRVPNGVLPNISLSIEDELKIIKAQWEKFQHQTTPTIAEESPDVKAERMIPLESFVDGNKIAEMTLTNVDGTNLVNIPVFVVTDMLDAELMDEHLERGAILMVSHPDVNPEMVENDNGIPRMGLPFEDGITNFFGHNKSSINPDWDGNKQNGNEGFQQKVFDLVDEAEMGSILEIKFTEPAGGATTKYVLSRTFIVRDVQPGGEGTGMTFAKATELYGAGVMDDSLVRLIKCTPDGKVTDRYIAEFIPVE